MTTGVDRGPFGAVPVGAAAEPPAQPPPAESNQPDGPVGAAGVAHVAGRLDLRPALVVVVGVVHLGLLQCVRCLIFSSLPTGTCDW